MPVYVYHTATHKHKNFHTHMHTSHMHQLRTNKQNIQKELEHATQLDIIRVQETKITTSKTQNIPDYTQTCADRDTL